jgi:tRNA(fMet)-specific endonuclease VapC
VIRILLDTSAYSAHLRGHSEIADALQLVDEVHLNVVVLGELRAGFLKGGRPRQNEAILGDFLARPRVRVDTLDEETSRRYAEIYAYLRKRGTPISANDLWIAASASQHGLRVFTTDPDFKSVPQVAVDYFEPA